MQRKKYVMANWKMNGSISRNAELVNKLLQGAQLDERVVLFPPNLYLAEMNRQLSGSPVALGAQNLYPETHGAFTGEVSAPMLKEMGCRFVLVGHSERRSLFSESDIFVAKKFYHAKEHGMMPVLCIGESSEERNSGHKKTVLARQLDSLCDLNAKGVDCFDGVVLAYEPIWAIGTGQTAEPEEVNETHAFIREFVAEKEPGAEKQMPILYGGSVNKDNASLLLAMPDVDGVLVGGASLDASHFLEIVKCIN